MKQQRVADGFHEPMAHQTGYDEFFGQMLEICNNRPIDQQLGEALKAYVGDWLSENSLTEFDNYSDSAYSRTYLGRSASGWEAIVMGWKRGNTTSVHSHPQFAGYNFADGEFRVEIFEPVGESRARLVETLEVKAPLSLFSVGKPGQFDNHIHRITCLSEEGHSLHIYSDDALRGLTYAVEE